MLLGDFALGSLSRLGPLVLGPCVFVPVVPVVPVLRVVSSCLQFGRGAVWPWYSLGPLRNLPFCTEV